MNKKFLTVIGSAAIAAAFWACGGGDIYEATDNDIVFKDLLSQSGALKNRCADSNGCDGAFDVESSSSSEEQVEESSSSNSGPAPQSSFSFRSSSSSIEVIPTSSEEAKPVTGLGSCAPLKSPVDKNTASAQFKFTPNATTSGYKPVDFAAATYEWDFGANGSAASNGGSTSQMVTYAASGSVTASVVVTMKDGSSEKITCTPLQVNGDPITGCKCTTSATSADIADASTSTVSWTVSGCLSSSEITSYSWPTGFVGSGVSGSHTFTKKDETVTPVVVVGNNDNTKVNVECPSVFAIDGNNPDTVTPGSTSTVYKGARKYSFASCNNKTGEVTIQVASNVKDCAKLITSETTIASSVSYWNNADGNCTFESKAAFPMTVALAEGQTFQFTGGCY